jgi:hypothetical protein
MDQGGARGAAGPASAPGSAVGGPPGARRATSTGTQIKWTISAQLETGTWPSSSFPIVQARDHRIRRPPLASLTRSATPTVDPAVALKDAAPTRKWKLLVHLVLSGKPNCQKAANHSAKKSRYGYQGCRPRQSACILMACCLFDRRPDETQVLRHNSVVVIT